MDSPDVRGLPKMWEEGRLKVEPASENTCVAMGGGGGGREGEKGEGWEGGKGRDYLSKTQEKNKVSLSLPFLTVELGSVMRESVKNISLEAPADS